VNGRLRSTGRSAVRRVVGNDAGSMIPLVLGLVLITTLLVTVVTDVGSMWLARRSLQATVDGAALAGSRAVDLAAIYAGQSRGRLTLDSSAAKQAVRDFVAISPSTRQLRSFRVTAIRVSGSTITVRVQATIRPPFISLLSSRDVQIVAQASAETITR